MFFGLTLARIWCFAEAGSGGQYWSKPQVSPNAASWDPGVFGQDYGLETEVDTRSVLGYSDMTMGYRESVA